MSVHTPGSRIGLLGLIAIAGCGVPFRGPAIAMTRAIPETLIALRERIRNRNEIRKAREELFSTEVRSTLFLLRRKRQSTNRASRYSHLQGCAVVGVVPTPQRATGLSP